MSNRYGSNVRTYTARNLMWNCDAASGLGRPVPYTLSAPTPLTIRTQNATISEQKSFLPVLYQAQVPRRTDWNENSYIQVRRAGIFSNFADGLVQALDKVRIKMLITVQVCDFVKKTSMAFVADANTVASTEFGTTAYPTVGYDNRVALPPAPSPGDQYVAFYTANGWIQNYGYRWSGSAWVVLVKQYDFLFDADPRVSATQPAFGYVIKNPQSDTPNVGYLTDYAFRSETTGSATVYRSNALKRKTFTLNNLSALNLLYETELFFPYVAQSSSEILAVSCALEVDSYSAKTLDFLTASIDPAFNGSVVSFDSVVEIEVTPYRS